MAVEWCSKFRSRIDTRRNTFLGVGEKVENKSARTVRIPEDFATVTKITKQKRRENGEVGLLKEGRN